MNEEEVYYGWLVDMTAAITVTMQGSCLFVFCCSSFDKW